MTSIFKWISRCVIGNVSGGIVRMYKWGSYYAHRWLMEVFLIVVFRDPSSNAFRPFDTLFDGLITTKSCAFIASSTVDNS